MSNLHNLFFFLRIALYFLISQFANIWFILMTSNGNLYRYLCTRPMSHLYLPVSFHAQVLKVVCSLQSLSKIFECRRLQMYLMLAKPNASYPSYPICEGTFKFSNSLCMVLELWLLLALCWSYSVYSIGDVALLATLLFFEFIFNHMIFRFSYELRACEGEVYLRIQIWNDPR